MKTIRSFVRSGLLAGACLMSSAALAGPFADAATGAEAKATEDPVAAMEAAQNAFADFAESLRFTIANTTFIGEPAAGFGMITPREAKFKPGEPLVVYAEPVGLHWKEGGRGYQSQFTVDVDLLSPDGKVLGGQKDFGKFGFDSEIRNQEIMSTLTLNLDGVPPGDYVVRYTFHDVVSGASADTELPFTVAE